MGSRQIRRWFIVLVCGAWAAAAWGQDNQLLNYEFDQGTNSWGRYDGGVATGFTSTVVQGARLSGPNALLLNVVDTSVASIGVSQGNLKFTKGQTYQVGVTAKADREREMIILIQLYKPEGPSWIDIVLEHVKLTTKAQTFVFEYTHNDDSMADHPTWQANIFFMLKGAWWSMVGDTQVSKVWMDCPFVGEQPALQASLTTQAFLPEPADGAVIDPTVVTLKWKPGDLAVTHQVYFSDDPVPIQAGTVAPVSTALPSLAVGGAAPYANGLTPGTLYWWRVDEVNNVTASSPWAGSLWNFLVRPPTSWRPDPPDNARFVETNRKLSWSIGKGSFFNTVYFGLSAEAVNDPAAAGTLVANPLQGNLQYDPGPLQPGTTYFWRVDQFQQTGTVRGNTWRFTTAAAVEGLQAEYFDNPDLAGDPAITRSDPNINFNWGNGTEQGINSPDAKIPVDNFSARWTGEVEADVTDTYVFSVTANNGFRLWLDGRLIIDYWGNTTTDTRRSAPVPLTAGQTCTLRMEYTEGTGVALAQLYWESAVQNKTNARIRQTIPAGALQPPRKAHSPQPDSGAVGTAWSLDLTWTAGNGATQHRVYFGDDAQAVAQADTSTATIYQGTQAGTTFAVSDLEWGRSYFWRVDEVNDAGVLAGAVWSFTTADYMPVDDFESYNDEEGQGTRVYETWLDGWFDSSSGSQVGYTDPPFAELKIVHGGGQSMPLLYDNSKSPFFSQVVREFSPAQDWTVHNLGTLVLYVRGKTANAPAPLFVGLEDAAGHKAFVRHPDSTPVTTPAWAEWRIPLRDFTGVNPAKITKVYLRLGELTNPAAGGTGLLFVDDIRVAVTPAGQ
jgi:hypothetical protein